MSEEKKQQVSRRQFLNYTLLGVGGFMAAGVLISPIRMAIDPVLQSTDGSDLTNVGLSVDDITTEPQRVDWSVDQVDGWHESSVNRSAWVFRNEEDEIEKAIKASLKDQDDSQFNPLQKKETENKFNAFQGQGFSLSSNTDGNIDFIFY